MRINLKSTSHLRGAPFIKRVFILSFRAFKFSFKFRRTTNWRDHFKPCHDSWPVMIPDRPWLLTGHDSWPVMITDRSWLLTGHDYWPVMIPDRPWLLTGHDSWPAMITDRSWLLTGHDYWPVMIPDRPWFLTGHDSSTFLKRGAYEVPQIFNPYIFATWCCVWKVYAIELQIYRDRKTRVWDKTHILWPRVLTFIDCKIPNLTK